jgi:hypothetical protein
VTWSLERTTDGIPERRPAGFTERPGDISNDSRARTKLGVPGFIYIDHQRTWRISWTVVRTGQRTFRNRNICSGRRVPTVKSGGRV